MDLTLRDKSKDWVANHYWTTFAIFMFVVWGSLFLLFWLRTDAIQKDPCGICSKRMGENVMCTLSGLRPITRTYYPNTSYSQSESEVAKNFNTGEVIWRGEE